MKLTNIKTNTIVIKILNNVSDAKIITKFAIITLTPDFVDSLNTAKTFLELFRRDKHIHNIDYEYNNIELFSNKYFPSPEITKFLNSEKSWSYIKLNTYDKNKLHKLDIKHITLVVNTNHTYYFTFLLTNNVHKEFKTIPVNV